MSRKLVVSILSSLALCFMASAADLKADPNFRVFIDREKALAEAAKADLTRFPDADSVLIADFEHAEYRPDASGLRWDEYYTKVLTEKGRREARTLSLDFTLPYSRSHVLLGEVIKPDGKVIPIDIAANSKEMVDDSQMGSNIFNPNDKALKVTVPELAIGDVVHWLSFTEDFKPRMEGAWCSYHVLESDNPILSYTVEVVAPDKLPLKSIALKSPVEGRNSYESKSENGVTTHRWTVKGIPQYFPEPEMPPAYTVVQRLLISTISDWQTVSKWYWNLCQPRLAKTTPEMKATVEELIKGKDSIEDKTRAIFKFVSQKIRYMGLTTEEVSPGYEPHDVDITFNNKYGVCRDKAALLVAMLRLAGLEAFPVIINAGPKKDFEVPMPYFNHAISAVMKPDGSYILMDSTDETTAELLPAYLSNCSYLVARPDGDTLRTSPIVPASENMMNISTTGKLDASGQLIAKSVMDFGGINDNAYRGRLLSIKPEERRLFFESKLKSVVDGASLKSLKITPEDLQDTSVPLHAEIEFSAKDLLAKGRDEAMLPLPWLGSSFGTVNFILGPTGLDKRRFPLVTDIACGVAEKMDIDLGGSVGKPLSLPKDRAGVDVPTVLWRQSFDVSKGGVLSAQNAFAINVVEFSPEQYLALREALKTVQSDRRQRPVFSASVEEPKYDSIVLDSRVDYALSADGSFTATQKVKRKILTYAGTKSFSEIKTAYNPIWDKVSVKATVTGMDGSVKTMGGKELNVMDAPWAASAPRYPAGKILVASLPGVAIGSIIESEAVLEAKGRPFFSAMEPLKLMSPLEAKTVTITLPDSGAPRLKFNIVPDANENGGSKLVWSVKDVPAVKPEDSLPPFWAFMKTLLASSGDWNAYSKSVLSAFNAAASSQNAAEAKARELCAGAASQSERAIRIRDFVAKSIRLAGPKLGELPLSCLTPADKTLADGYGNAADRAILLFSMLKAAGFEPEFLLASDEPAASELFSLLYYNVQAGLFSSPLVRAKVDGAGVLFNDTTQYDKLGASRHYGAFALDLKTTLVGILKAPSEDLETRKDTLWSIANGEIERRVLFYGTAYGEAKQRYAEMTPEELRRHHQELVASIAQSAKPVSPLKADFSNYPGVLSFKVKSPDYIVSDGSRSYFRLPGGGFANIFRLRSESRVNPYFLSSDAKERISFKVDLPGGLQIGPQPFSWTQAGSKVTLFTRAGAASFEAVCDFDFEPAVIPPAEYGSLKELERLLCSPSANNILLKTP